MMGDVRYRAEVVGSLLRPPALAHALGRVYREGERALLPQVRERDLDSLREAEDAAIRDAVRRQRDCGLDVVTDGEYRRYMFLNSFWDAVEGYSTDANPIEFRDDRGSTVTWHVQRIERRLELVDSPAAREAAFLAELDPGPFKVTFPAASLFAHPFTFTGDAYDGVASVVDHAIAIEQQLVADAIAVGCRYVQFDFPLYPYLCDQDWQARFSEASVDLGEVLDAAIAADRALVESVPDGVTTAIHVCRGNYRSRYLATGALDPIAERMFAEIPVDAWLIEWDDERRDGDFAALRHVPPGGPTIVLGLVSSKRPDVEREREIIRAIDRAAAIVPLDQLALSTQCGFASVSEGNEIDELTQWRKLELVGRVAEKVFR